MESNGTFKKLTIERTLKLDKANKELEITTTIKKTGGSAKRARSASGAKKATKKKEGDTAESGQKAIKPTAKALTGAKRRAESSEKKDAKLKKRPASAQKGSKLAKKRAAKANAKDASQDPNEQKLMKEFNQFLSSCSADQRNQLKKAILQKGKK